MEQLVAESDIFTENYIPGKLAKYGLSYDDLKKINPNIIYASLSGAEICDLNYNEVFERTKKEPSISLKI